MNPIIKMLKKSAGDYVPAQVPVRRGKDEGIHFAKQPSPPEPLQKAVWPGRRE